MNTGNITITLTESQHELILDMLVQAADSMNFCVPFDALCDLEMDNSILQRYTMVENLREMFGAIWSDRFAQDELTLPPR